MTLSASSSEPVNSEAHTAAPRTALDHKIQATMSVLECIDQMELLLTFLQSLSKELLSTNTRKVAKTVSGNLKKASKVLNSCSGPEAKRPEICKPGVRTQPPSQSKKAATRSNPFYQRERCKGARRAAIESPSNKQI